MQNHNSNRVKERNSPSRPNRKAAGRPERARRSPRLVDHAIESCPSISEASTAVADAAEHPSTPVVRVAPPNWNGNTKFINFAPNPKAQLSPLNTSKPQETQSEPSPQTPKLGAPTVSTANSYLHSPHSGSYTDDTSLEYSAFENRRNPAKMTILRENHEYPDPFNKQKSTSFFSSLAKRDSAVFREEHANSMSSPNSPHHHNNDMFNGLADLAFYSLSLEKLNSQGKFQKRLLRFDGNILLIMSKAVESTRSKQKLMEFDLMESSHSLISNDLQSYIRSNYPAGLPASLAKVIISKGNSTSPDPNSCKYYVPKYVIPVQDIKSIESNLHSADGESEIPRFSIITSKDRIDFRVESYVSMAKIQFLLETAIDAKQRIRSLILSGAKGSAKVSEMQILNRKVFNAVQYSWKKCLNSVIARDTVQREYATTVHVNCAGGVNVLDGLVIVPLNDGSSEVMNESYNQNVTGPPVTDTEGTLVGSPVSMKPDQKAAMIEGTAETTNEDFKPECEEEVEVPEKDAPEDDKLEMVEVHVL